LFLILFNSQSSKASSITEQEYENQEEEEQFGSGLEQTAIAEKYYQQQEKEQ
jgi:hypothetical protein